MSDREPWFMAPVRRLPPNGRADRIIGWLAVAGLVLLAVGIWREWW